MGGKEESRLLQSKNRIVKLERHSTPNNGDQITLALDRGNLDGLVKSTMRQMPSFSNCPVVLFSVLGNNKDKLRELHTDWLVHYYENHGDLKEDIADITDLFKSWHPRFGPMLLKYVGQCAEAEPGVYLWPTPFHISEEFSTEAKKGQEQQLLGFILYAHALGGNYHDPRSSVILDYLVACVTQKIVVFKTAEKDKLANFVKTMNGNILPPLTTFIESTAPLALASSRTQEYLARGWDAFIKSLKSKESILKGKEKANNLPTLESLVNYMEVMISKMNVPSEAADTMLLNVIAKDVSARNEARRKRTPTPPSSPRPVIYSSHVSFPAEENNDIEAFQAQFQRWLIEDIKLPQDVRKIVQDLRIDQWMSMQNRLAILQRIMQGYNLELQNMFDNYVCFSGSVDEKQIIRFQEAARQREKSNWKAAQLGNNIPDDPILEMIRTGITKWLCKRYVEENFGIVENEDKLGAQVYEMLAKAYISKMKILMNGREGSLRLSEAHVIHKRMLNQCCSMMNRCMDYGGRLNNVVMKNMTVLEQVLNEQFAEWKCKNLFYKDEPEMEKKLDDEDGIISAYMREIDANLSKYPTRQLENLHDVTFRKLANGVQGADRDDLETILLSYLVYTSEQFQEQLQNSPGGNDAPIMCIHFTSEWIKAIVRLDNGWKDIEFQQQDGSNNEWGCPARVSLIKGKFGLGYDAKIITSSKGKVHERDWHGTVFNCIKSASKINLEMATDILRALFEQIWNLGGQKVGGGQVVVVVPSWFSVDDRALLRSSATAAGLKKAFLVNESSLTAFSLFTENKSEKLVCVVIARLDAVRVEIFDGTDPLSEGKGISLAALAFGEWSNAVMDPKRPPENFMHVLEATFERAVGQLPMGKRDQAMICYLQTDYPDWRPQLVVFFWTKKLVLREEDEEDFVAAGARKLCSNPNKIRQLLLDYATPKLEGDATDFISPVLSAEHQEILRKCQVMEMQLNNKEVRMGVLTRKIAFETIERARLNVRTNQNTEKEEWELEELISIHKFKI